MATQGGANTALHSQYNDNDYKNWIRACLGLKYLKAGIVDFVDNEVQKFHNGIMQKYCSGGTCNQCKTEDITDRRRPQTCPKNICDHVSVDIHNNHRFRQPYWKNTDVAKWCTDHWEVAKCFMSPGYAGVTSAAKTDCTGLLSVCINGVFLPPTVTGQIVKPPGQPSAQMDIFHKNREARNKLLHSGAMRINDQERRDCLNDMMKLLKTYKTPVDAVTQDNIDKLTEINTVSIDIVATDELSVIHDKLEAIMQNISQAEAEKHDQDLVGNVCRLQARVQKDSDSLTVLRDRLEQLQYNSDQNLTELQSTCNMLTEKNTDVQEWLLRLEERTSQLEAKVNLHKATMDSLGQRLEQVEGGMCRKETETGMKDIQDFLVAKYKRDASTIQVSPLLQRYSVDIDEIYTDLIIRDDLMYDPEKKAKKRVNLPKSGCSSAMKVESYHDVLFNGSNICEDIYVLGKAGMGKTTWCRKFVSTWVRAMDRKDKGCIVDVNEAVLQDYDLVFYISLRYAKDDTHVLDMIEHQLFPHNPDLFAAVKGMLNNPDISNRCVFILDGLDEWRSSSNDLSSDGIPVKNPTWKCPTILTTRPWKLESLQVGANKIDRAIEICGLQYTQTRTLVGRVVSALNKHTKKSKTAADFMDVITESIGQCMQIPLLLTIFVCLWHDGVQIKDQFADTYTKLTEMLIRYAEGDKRQKIWQKIPHEKLSEMKRTWRGEKCPEPKFFNDRKLLSTYMPFLVRLGKLAFDALFSADSESALVFDYQTLETEITDDELDLALIIGILSQTSQSNLACEHEFSLSFLHKTVQEYFASLYMVYGDNTAECLRRYNLHCSNASRVLEMDNILLFVAGMCTKTASEMSGHVSNMESDKLDLLTEDFLDLSCGRYHGIYQEHDVHKLLLRCWREMGRPSGVVSGFYIKHHFWYTNFFSDQYNNDTLCYLQNAPDQHISFYFDLTNYGRGDPQLKQLDLSVFQTLRELHLGSLSQPTHGLRIHEANVASCLLITNNVTNVAEPKSLLGTVLDLSGSHSLETLSYNYPSVPLQVPTSLKSITIVNYKPSSEICLDLSGFQYLETLCYNNSSAPLMIPTSLKTVTVIEYTPRTDTVLNLSVCSSLETLHYEKSTPMLIVSKSLRKLTMFDYKPRQKVVLDLSMCHSLERLSYNISFASLIAPTSLKWVKVSHYISPSNAVLDLSGCGYLGVLEYSESAVPLLVPSSLKRLAIIEYEPPAGITMDLCRCHALETLVYSRSSAPLVASNSIRKLEIIGYQPSVGMPMDLSGLYSLKTLVYARSPVPLIVPTSLQTLEIYRYNPPTGTVLDLSACLSLETLRYENASARLLVPQNLRQTDIDGYRPPSQAVLNMSECHLLESLTYSMGSAMLLVPHNLCKLKIFGYSPSAGSVLDLSPCQSLTKLVYQFSSAPVQILEKHRALLKTDCASDKVLVV